MWVSWQGIRLDDVPNFGSIEISISKTNIEKHKSIIVIFFLHKDGQNVSGGLS